MGETPISRDQPAGFIRPSGSSADLIARCARDAPRFLANEGEPECADIEPNSDSFEGPALRSLTFGFRRGGAFGRRQPSLFPQWVVNGQSRVGADLPLATQVIRPTDQDLRSA